MARITGATSLLVLAALALAPDTGADAGAADKASPEARAVKLTQLEDRIRVEVGGKLFTEYRFAEPKDDPKAGPYVRPYLFPVLGPGGQQMTSDQKTSGGDHPHHRSIWVSHGEVNGADHWALDKNPTPRQRHVGFAKVEGDTIVQELEWEAKEGEGAPPLLRERRTLRFFVFADGSRGIDLTVHLMPAGTFAVTFGDTKEAGLCSVRVSKAISDTGTITNAAGATGEPAAWGKPAVWCDISGQVDGKPCGIAALDHPSNPRHPATWHVRQYGLMSANIFGLHDFDESRPENAGDFTIEAGQTATFRYRIVIHEGDAMSADLDTKFNEFAAGND